MKQDIKKAIKEYGFITNPGGEAKKNIEDLILVMDKLKGILPTKSFNNKGENAATISELNKLFLSTKDAKGREYTAPINDNINKMLTLIYDLPDVQRQDPQDVMKPRLQEDVSHSKEFSFPVKELKTIHSFLDKKTDVLEHPDSEWYVAARELRKLGYSWEESDYLIASYLLNVETENWEKGEDFDIPETSFYTIHRDVNFSGYGNEEADNIEAYSTEHAEAMAYDGDLDFENFEVQEYTHWDVDDQWVEDDDVANEKRKRDFGAEQV
jgi:hypothetical protein